MDNKFDSVDKNRLFKAVNDAFGGKIGKGAVDSAKNGDYSALLSSLGEDDKKKILSALDNKESAKKLLSSDAAKKLLSGFLNGGKR